MKSSRLITQKEKVALVKRIKKDLSAFSRGTLARGEKFGKKKRKGLI